MRLHLGILALMTALVTGCAPSDTHFQKAEATTTQLYMDHLYGTDVDTTAKLLARDIRATTLTMHYSSFTADEHHLLSTVVVGKRGIIVETTKDANGIWGEPVVCFF